MTLHHTSQGGCFRGAYEYQRRSTYNYRDAKPVPPLDEYEAWQATMGLRGRHKIDAQKYRRIVILMRGGERYGTAAKMVGLNPKTKATFDRMPDHLK